MNDAKAVKIEGAKVVKRSSLKALYHMATAKVLEKNSIGYRIRTLRTEKKLTQKQLCERVHISHGSMSNYETGTNVPDDIIEALAKELGLVKPGTFDLLWVVHFPLFEKSEETGEITPCHHPFTRPRDEDLKYLDTDPTKILSYAYDIVINGYEAGGGSLRIYDQDVQKKIFSVLGLSDEDIKRKFGFFVDAFQYGTPPHAGMAFGLDRLTMILGGTDNIRDVIAFPKNLAAVCPMSLAPNTVDEAQLKELGIAVTDYEK